MSGFNDRIIADFRANGGRVGYGFEISTMVLVHSVGAKTGTEYVTPLVYFTDGDDWVVVASAAGALKHPGWFHNLVANPETSIEVGTETVLVTASEISGEERTGLFSALAARNPVFADYQRKAGDRAIPLVRLARR